MNFLDLWLLGTIPNFGKFLAVIEIFLLHSLFFFSPSGIPILHHLKFSQSSWIFFFFCTSIGKFLFTYLQAHWFFPQLCRLLMSPSEVFFVVLSPPLSPGPPQHFLLTILEFSFLCLHYPSVFAYYLLLPLDSLT